MAITTTSFDHFWKQVVTGGINLATDTLKLALVTSAYTPDIQHTQWSDVSAYEVASGNGYTTGGMVLSTVPSDNSHMKYANVTWTALTKSFRYGVLYKLGTANGLTNPLLLYILFDSTPADVVNTGSNFVHVWNEVDGLFYRPA